MKKPLSLAEAERVISRELKTTDSENVPLLEALGRIPFSSCYALQPVPGYTQATYDGYVIAGKSLEETENRYYFRLMGEIAAGDSLGYTCRPGSCYRIMTGAMVPSGGWKVIAQEYCHKQEGVISIEKAHVDASSPNIKKRGSEISRGSLIAAAGKGLTPASLGILADTGHTDVKVHRRPKVSFFCTGNELVEKTSAEAAQKQGMKVSSNRVILGSLVRAYGAFADDCGMVADSVNILRQRLNNIMARNSDIIISTGGMGPGKYDLIEETFDHLGGKIFFTSLKLLPGKAVLFGRIGQSIYFGMPGPPHAVKALFHVLIEPVLLKMQGLFYRRQDRRFQAFLAEDFSLRKSKKIRLIEGVSSVKKGYCTVRKSRSGEIANCYIFGAAGRLNFTSGQPVTVQAISPPAYLSPGPV